MEAWKQIIKETGIIPVVKIEKAELAVELAQILMGEGISVIEITFRTSAAEEAIRAIRKHLPSMLVGAGTVLNTDQLTKAISAGAHFIVTPGFNPIIVERALELKIPIIPGVSSASEIEQALSHGLDTVKYFPAVPLGGVLSLKSLNGPYPNVMFIPTGGLNLENMNEFLEYKNILAIGGSWMVDPKDLESKDFDRIKEKTAEAVQKMIGLEFDHIGFKPECFEETVHQFEKFLRIKRFDHSKSSFVSDKLEIIHEFNPKVLTQHLAYRVNDIQRAMHYFISRGYSFDMDTQLKDTQNNIKAIYFKEIIGGYSIHLIKK